MKNKEKIDMIGKEYKELAEFITREIFKQDDLQIGYEIIRKFAQGGWIWSRMD